ncbi:non-ribosomal peptide synthetase [Paenibacillus sp. BJ-4]|uniref:non-ribosomal peptide synthetase n=1 Tax=Paenibacillus sp. BJ-4 TaxID=2878097 RepID=UPI001CEFCE94|nr:non-ribosomal peptide synthetase [Paenibacillus sp. BJ-4]
MQMLDNKKIYNCCRVDISNNNLVGILLKRNVSLISTILSCYKNGITYIPIDSEWPEEQICAIISANDLNVVITIEEYINRVSCPNIIVVDDESIIEFTQQFKENETSYILYTSGSTGQPKGVEVKRESLLNFIDGISETIDFSPSKRIACLTTVSFDIFFLESIMALEKGLTVVLANEDEQRNPKLMAKLIQENNVDMIQMTPSRMQLLLNYDKELSCLKQVKEIMIGGEPFPLSLLRTLQNKTTAKIYNMFGPTETTIWSTVSELTHKDRIDIGRPIKNTEVYIVDENLSILPNGQAGEICIAGKGLAKGYIGREDLTDEKFLYLPQKPDVRIYRTGDLGRYLPDNDLEYLGRIDNQVKIRGHRIELEGIEANINQFDGIKQSVVTLETSETDKGLQAFYTSDQHIEHSELLNYLSLKLPKYMIPVIFKRVEDFIQTVNGKIDRKRVLECVEINDENSMPENSDFGELSDIQKRAFEAIVSKLDSNIAGDITLETEFTSVGLNSITFINIVVDLESEFKFEFENEKLLIQEFPTIQSMIEYLESKISGNCG